MQTEAGSGGSRATRTWELQTACLGRDGERALWTTRTVAELLRNDSAAQREGGARVGSGHRRRSGKESIMARDPKYDILFEPIEDRPEGHDQPLLPGGPLQRRRL